MKVLLDAQPIDRRHRTYRSLGVGSGRIPDERGHALRIRPTHPDLRAPERERASAEITVSG